MFISNAASPTLRRLVFFLTLICVVLSATAQTKKPAFHVIGFYTGKNDLAHISFLHEAHRWLTKAGAENNFTYDSTNDWNNMNAAFLAKYQVVLFLDTRPDSPAQRKAFEQYMEGGGAWLGFHFAAFALTPSAYPQNWDWYHEKFLGVGQFKSNTWRPVPAMLKVEAPQHPVTKGLTPIIKSAPSEWYRWNNDIRNNPDIKILLSVDSSSFPLGTGPKLHEIWHSGYYPIVWTNTKYRMIYMNMGHNDMAYEDKSNATLSSTFSSEMQNKLIVNALLWLGRK